MKKEIDDMANSDKKKIFVAINFDEPIKNELVSCQNKIDYLFLENNPIKWTKKQNLHVTVFFIGYVYDTDLVDIFNGVEESAKKYKPFSLTFNQVDFMPKDSKKMIWVFGEKNETLESLRQDIKKNILSTEREVERFTSHITLARINQFQFRKINEEEIPNINDEILIDFNTEVESIDIMESELKKGGAEYTILKSIKL
ncbi:MAG: RNA 2',3'-cyclic phosphodiesterase [Candidatus Pacebacteria bacterium]|nr:RNA 2',3'-cyclic phosphodiesterase [Candidatus Paceibacterota bacterium]